jgi:hypothetical protein
MSSGLFLIPIIAGLGSQLLKLAFTVRGGKPDWRVLNEYGGMPSSHTAFMVSLSTAVGLHEGFRSAAFAVAFITMLIIVRDAIGFRQYLSEHGRLIKGLLENLSPGEQSRLAPHLQERLGHTPLEALVGGLLGIGMTLILYPVFFPS